MAAMLIRPALEAKQARDEARTQAGGPEHAVALEYGDSPEAAPQILAQGRGEAARQIVAIAERHDIPVYRDELLTSMFSAVEIGQTISPEAYRLMAEVICFLYDADRALAEGVS